MLMFHRSDNDSHSDHEALYARGYWPALAGRYLEEGKYSKAVETCKEYLADTPELLSGRLIYARALYHAGQTDSATEQFHYVMALDPDNLVALKYLGDIQYAAGQELSALASYRRAWEIDPYTRCLCSPLRIRQRETTRTVTLRRPQEPPGRAASWHIRREVPFYTETMGDLYLAQGYPRMAAEVYRELNLGDQNPRLREKLGRAQEKIKEKEGFHVKKAD